jgi:hypothetical protein
MEEIDTLAEDLSFVVCLYAEPPVRITASEPLHKRDVHIL